MKSMFWACFALTAYAYVGYAAWLLVVVRMRRRPVQRTAITPSISIVIAARNEATNLAMKLENLRALDYPADLMQVVIASDGSTDATETLLRSAGPSVVPVILKDSGGKAAALNAAVQQTSGEILLFLDARQRVDPSAARQLVACFADPDVGAVSGELLLESDTGESADNALGLYWKIEKMIRKLESESGSVVGVTGAIYAIRHNLYREIPAGTILDDVFVPMHVAQQGKRVIFEPTAIARDRIFKEKGKEFSRKVRTLTGNYQLLRLAPWLLSPANPLLFRFISHKMLRLLVPVFLATMVVTSLLAQGPVYRLLFWAQVLFYLLALAGSVVPAAKRLKPVAIANTFVMLNAAAALALYNFVAGRKRLWV